MMTLSDVQKHYDVNDQGTITSPGKFEGEQAYVVALWDLVMGGCSDEDVDDNGMLVSVFTIDAELIAAWPDAFEVNTVRNDAAVLLWESDNGFVNSSVVTKDELTAFYQRIESAVSEEDSE